MSLSSLKTRMGRAVLLPLKPAVDRVLDELSRRQEASATATQERLEALAAGTRLLRGSVLELADDVRAGGAVVRPADELALLRAAALGAAAACGQPRVALAIGDGVAADLAALGIEAAGDDSLALIVVVSPDLSEMVPLERLSAGGTLVLAAGRASPAARVAELTDGLSVEGSAALVPAGAGFDTEPNAPSREEVARLVVARRPR